MKKIITTLALVCVLSTPLTPQVNAQELSPEREAEMRTQIEVLQQIVEKLLALYELKFGAVASSIGGVVAPAFLELADSFNLNTSPEMNRFLGRTDDTDEERATSATEESSSVLGNSSVDRVLDSLSITPSFDLETLAGFTPLMDESSASRSTSRNTSTRSPEMTHEEAFSKVLSYAETLYARNGIYGAVCNKSEVVTIERDFDATCIDSPSQYLMYTEVSGGYYCVDTTGFVGQTNDVDADAMECGELLESDSLGL